MHRNNIEIWTPDLPGYRLLDSGDKKKLEEIGGYRLVRSEPRAWWQPRLPQSEWDKASALFTQEKGKWIFKKECRDVTFDFKSIKVWLKFPPTSKHIGIFPEQASQWEWMREKICSKKKVVGSREIKILNLFGYTGISSLVAAQAGAEVVHVDGSRAVIGWARENQELSGLSEANIRWILDDVVSFVKRDVKRGNKYDGIIMDPPSFGRGPKGEVWKVEDDLVEFINLCKQILTPEPLFVILNMYSTELSPITLHNLLEDMMGKTGEVVAGELALRTAGTDRLLPLSIFANWSYKG